ncbi:MAG TPA: hypothetical protein VFQ92_08865 [Blastocatellia bacterium]|nr:hypothetical protein [Blastocatellia bacterium]
MKRQRRVWTARGLVRARPLTEAEKQDKSAAIAAFNGSQAAIYARAGNEVLASAWARNAASAAYHVIGR